jgi:hypothetical protein
MKTSSFLASVLLGSLAIAAPLEKRALVTKTATVIETQVVYVTVWDGQVPVAEPTPTPIYEQSSSSKVEASATTSAAYTPPVEEKETSSSSSPVTSSSAAPPPPPPTPSSTKEETPVYTPPPAPPASTPSPTPVKEEPAPVYTPEPSPTPAEAPAPAYTPPANNAPANQFHGDLTVYDTYNGKGACGTDLSDGELTAAVSKDIWGEDIWSEGPMNANPWCGKSATVTYNGKSVTVKIMDKCQGCAPGDIDVTRAAWNQLTDNAYGSRVDASWGTA